MSEKESRLEQRQWAESAQSFFTHSVAQYIERRLNLSMMSVTVKADIPEGRRITAETDAISIPRETKLTLTIRHDDDTRETAAATARIEGGTDWTLDLSQIPESKHEQYKEIIENALRLATRPS